MTKPVPTETDAVSALALKAAGQPVEIKTDQGREFVALPDGFTIKDVTEPNAVAPILPDHVKQAITIQTAESLVEYVNRFKTRDTILLANLDANAIHALIDYHSASGDACVPTSQANHVAHRASMVLPFSFEWKTWTEVNGRLMPQLEFARFLEENGVDVAKPDGATLLEACRDLQAKRKVDFRKAVRTDSDNENFEFVDETNVSSPGGIEVPTKFLLHIPVYFGRRPVELYAHLRWKLDEGNLFLGVQLNRAEHVRQAEFRLILTEQTEQTGCPAMFGKLAA